MSCPSVVGEFRTITLNDGTFIYDENSLAEYLSSLGFDIEDLIKKLSYDIIDYAEYYKQENDRLQIKLDNYYCACRNLASSVENICDIYEDKYKSKAIINILYEIKKVVQENRID